MKKLFLIFSLCSLLFSLGNVWAQFVVPALPETPVYDEVGILSTEEKKSLEEKIVSLEKETNYAIAIAVVKNLQGRTKEEAGLAILRGWGIGQKGVDNGLIILVAMAEREMRIELGRGMEGVITDLISKRIVDENLTPNFKEGRYAKGLDEAIDRMTPLLTGEVVELPEEESDAIGPILIIIFTFGWAFISILSSTKSWWLGGVVGAIIGVIAIGLYGAIFMGIGGLILDFFLSKYGYQKIRVIRDFQRRNGFGGGFGGFGGGKGGGGGWGGFGGGSGWGGGAGGKW